MFNFSNKITFLGSSTTQIVFLLRSLFLQISQYSSSLKLLQDMIMVAVNDVINQINKETEEKMGAYTKGMPGLF